MGSSEKFVVVRELYPETKGIFMFRNKKCPAVNDGCEIAFGMDSDGVIVRLPDAKARDAAVANGDRIFAVSKRSVDFSTVVVNICKEDGYEWNFVIGGEIKIADYLKFLLGWVSEEGSCGLDGIDSDRFAYRVAVLLEPIIRDEIRACRTAHDYRIRDIEEKDVLPSMFWKNVFLKAGVSLLNGLEIDVTEKTFMCPDREMKAKLAAEEEARKKLEEEEKREYQAFINREMSKAELEEIERQKKRAELDFELEKAKKEAEIRKCQIDTQQFQMANLTNDIAEINAAMEKAKGNVDKMEALAAALAEANAKMEAIADKLSKLDVLTDGTMDHCTKIDPAVSPRYQGMSDQFLEAVTQIKSNTKNAVTLTYQVRDARYGFSTRAIISDAYTARTLGAIGSACNQKQSGTLHIGDRVTIRMTSERAGYLTLINIGTTPGVVNKIFPDKVYGARTRHIEAGRHYVMPGDLIPCPDGCGYWPVGGATTAQYGLKERVLAIVTDSPVNIEVDGLLSEINGVLVRGEFGAVEKSLTSYMELLHQPEGMWSWGLLEAVVED